MRSMHLRRHQSAFNRLDMWIHNFLCERGLLVGPRSEQAPGRDSDVEAEDARQDTAGGREHDPDEDAEERVVDREAEHTQRRGRVFLGE
eukprot:219115-Rhodomonas_salina.1